MKTLRKGNEVRDSTVWNMDEGRSVKVEYPVMFLSDEFGGVVLVENCNQFPVLSGMHETMEDMETCAQDNDTAGMYAETPLLIKGSGITVASIEMLSHIVYLCSINERGNMTKKIMDMSGTDMFRLYETAMFMGLGDIAEHVLETGAAQSAKFNVAQMTEWLQTSKAPCAVLTSRKRNRPTSD